MADGVTVVLVDAPELFDRAGLYGETRTRIRRQRLSLCGAVPRARSSTRASSGERPSAIHAHDWQAGAGAGVRADNAAVADATIGGGPVVFTIHNLAFQGKFPISRAAWIVGLGWDLFTPQVLEFWGRASSLKGGVDDERQDHDRQPDVREARS